MDNIADVTMLINVAVHSLHFKLKAFDESFDEYIH
jgi:hypothetical protein